MREETGRLGLNRSRRWRSWGVIVCWILCALPFALRVGDCGGFIFFDEEMENYQKTADTGELKRLQNRLDGGSTRWSRDPKHGYLLALLKELNVPVSSQMLVATKTSWNNELVCPKNPRALYYNDHASVAYVPGADVIEIAATDPRLGLVFYTLDQNSADKPKLQRDDRCLDCHASSRTLGVPGLVVRSFRTKADGEVDLLSGIAVTHRTPLGERWGGYYVTGTHGSQTHLGNLVGTEALARYAKEPSSNGNVSDLCGYLDMSKYPARGSDIVALMVLEHQAHLQALLTRLACDGTKALCAGEDLKSVYPACEAVLKDLFFVGEAKLTAPVRGTSDFAEAFQQQGPTDKQGRSLREFDLQTRLFRYPCSYLIYSESFAAMPERVRRHLYRRMHEILLGEDKSADYAGLTLETRNAIYEILLDTVKDLPINWRLDGVKSSSSLFETNSR